MSDSRIEGTIRAAALLVSAGLVVEFASLYWRSPAAFVLFAVSAPLLALAGIALFLLALVRR